MLNRICIMGRLTRDPELRQTQSGQMAAFTLAVDRDFVNKQTGQRETDFIDCVAFNHTAEFLANYFTKGRMVVCVGRLQINAWSDKDGNKRRSASVAAESVYFGDSKAEGRTVDNRPYSGDGEAERSDQGIAPYGELPDRDPEFPF